MPLRRHTYRFTSGSEELRDRCGGPGCAVGLDGAVVDLSPYLLGDCGGYLRRAVELEVHAPTGPVALEAVAYMEVLLEVMPQWEVQERAPVGGQLHRRREPTLDDGEIAGSEMTVEVVLVGPQFQPLDLRQRRWVVPRACDDDHPQLGSVPFRLGERLDHPAEQVTAHT
jgi:hypothetical protein